MAALPASNPSVYSNVQGVNIHGGEHSATGRDMIYVHIQNASDRDSQNAYHNSMNVTSGYPGRSASSSLPLSVRARFLDIIIDSILEAELLDRSSPVAMIPKETEMYQRLMLEHRHGYPLYHPEPKGNLPIEYRRKGVRIGDVGRITPTGAFDFLFNVYSPQASSPYQPALPRGFEPAPPTGILHQEYFQSDESLLSGHVQQVQDTPIKYKFSAPDASVLQLPEGATLFEAENINELYDLAARHAPSWYEHMFTHRFRDIPNGSLYLITGCIKTINWGIGVLYGIPFDGNYLEFISEDLPARRAYRWKKSGPIRSKVGPTSSDISVTDNEEPNQCVFIHGYKIALGEKLLEKVRAAVSASPREGINTPFSFVGYTLRSGLGNSGNSLNQATPPSGSALGHVRNSGTITKDSTDHGKLAQYSESLLISNPDSDGSADEELESSIEPNFSAASPAHPSDIIISILTRLEPEAEVALVHDSEWRNVLPKDFASDPWNLDIKGLVENIARSCLAAVNQNGCISLVKRSIDLLKGPPLNVPEPPVDQTSEIVYTERIEATQGHSDSHIVATSITGINDTSPATTIFNAPPSLSATSNPYVTHLPASLMSSNDSGENPHEDASSPGAAPNPPASDDVLKGFSIGLGPPALPTLRKKGSRGSTKDKSTMSAIVTSPTLTRDRPTKHPKYYLNGGDLHLLVRGQLFRVHKYFFDRESPGFLSVRSFGHLANSGDSDDTAIVLDVDPIKFEKFLWVFYNPHLTYSGASVEDWTDILELAHEWSFTQVTQLVIRELQKLDMPVAERIALYQKYKPANDNKDHAWQQEETLTSFDRHEDV